VDGPTLQTAVVVDEAVAPFRDRVLATVADLGVLLVPTVALTVYLTGALLDPVTMSMARIDLVGSLILPLAFALFSGLYVVPMVARGQTLGMRLVGTRVARMRGDRPGWARSLGRWLVPTVLLVMWGLAGGTRAEFSLGWFDLVLELAPWLLALDLGWALYDRHGRALHDIVTGTQVVRPAPPAYPVAAGPPAAGETPSPAAASALLRDIGQLRQQARASAHVASAPLLVFGVLTLIGAPLVSNGPLFSVIATYWWFAAPIGLFATAWIYHRRSSRSGIGPGARPLLLIALITLALMLPLSLVVYMTPGAVVGAALIAIAVWARSGYLGVWGVLYGVLAGLENFAVLTNAVSRVVDVSLTGPPIIFALLALMLIGAGLGALRRERLPRPA
jgi:uncharacterized RDD family membrane protein YckC